MPTFKVSMNSASSREKLSEGVWEMRAADFSTLEKRLSYDELMLWYVRISLHKPGPCTLGVETHHPLVSPKIPLIQHRVTGWSHSISCPRKKAVWSSATSFSSLHWCNLSWISLTLVPSASTMLSGVHRSAAVTPYEIHVGINCCKQNCKHLNPCQSFLPLVTLC